MNFTIYSCIFTHGGTDVRQYRDLTAKYEEIDPARGKRKRKAIAGKLRDILEEFEGKADQIYALYDVVEGVRQEGLGASHQRDWLKL